MIKGALQSLKKKYNYNKLHDLKKLNVIKD